MYNYLTREEPQPRLFPHTIPLEVAPIPNRTNKFVYVKQNYTYTDSEPKKVLINPNFNKKVFINPNFNRNVVPPKIHINPHIQSIKLGVDECKNVKKILVNPNVLRNLPVSTDNRKLEVNCYKNSSSKNSEEKVVNTPLISTRTKLVRVAAKTIYENRIRKRRSSIRSQFKIIKSSLLEKSSQEEGKTKLKRNLIKSNPVFTNYLKTSKPPANKFKLDNRSKTIKSPKVKKYVYINRFLSISDIAKNNLLKQNKSKISTGNVGAINKKSLSPLTRNSNPYKKNNMKKIQGNIICKSKYRLMRKSLSGSLKNNQLVKQPKVSRVGKSNIGKNPSKLKICNVPCPYYRKFGRCKGKENGKCFRKHDPNKIALCTKFLQGACVDKKCLLSHNVSSEKMPTCKFYLEGSCARDDCPYLHVRINPKADICKEFLEGFCKKAAECDKRHQYLCPDYEKNGTCLKQRCPYPHGKMVRKYPEFNKNKFAKKCSDECGGKINITKDAVVDKIDNIKPENFKSDCFERNSKSRYYIKHTSLDTEGKNLASTIDQTDSTDHANVEVSSIKSRPQLGKLPSFISFENKN